MVMQGVQTAGYVVPTYEAAPGVVWYHFLHGNVPGHQIDFIYRPDVPQGALTQQHFSHLSQLMKYIEPRSRSAYAFAIGNLSRDDTQYEPGRGGVALIFGLRIHGATDHAGRQDPPFCHSVAAIDRHLDAAGLLEAALAFHRKLMLGEDGQATGSSWYHTYVGNGQNTDAVVPILRGYVADFDDLPAPRPSGLRFRWTTEGSTPPKRVVIVHREEEPFDAIAACAARIASVLMESDIRWTAISNGREVDLLGGVSVRLVPEQEARTEEAGVPVLRMKDVPQEPEEIAKQLFGARQVRISQVSELRMGWQQFHGQKASESDAARAVESAPAPVGHRSSVRPPPAEAGDGVVDGGKEEGERAEKAQREADTKGLVSEERKSKAGKGAGAGKKSRNQFGLLIAIGVVLALGGAMAAVVLGTKDSTVKGVDGGVAAVATAISTGSEKGAPTVAGMAVEARSAGPAETAAEAASAAKAVLGTKDSTGKGRKGGAGASTPTGTRKKRNKSVFEVP